MNSPQPQSKELQPIDKLCQSISNPSVKVKIQQLLPANIDADRFIRTMINGIQMHHQQDKLIKSDRRTLFLAAQRQGIL